MRIPNHLLALLLACLPAAAAEWQPLGPSPQNNGGHFVSGRVASIAFSPDYNGQGTPALYVGSASGGVWRGTNIYSGAVSWTPLTDNLGLPAATEAGAICSGAIAVDPFHPSTIYVGTGEAHFSVDSRYGAGILKSTDGGTTWTLTGANLKRLAISRIFVDPTDATGNTVYCSASSGANGYGSGFGVYKSTNAGATWTLTSAGIGSNPMVTDMEYTVTGGNTLVLYAAVGSVWGSSLNGVYKSTNGGKGWTKLITGLPTASNMGRLALAAEHTPGPAPVVMVAVTYNFNVSGKGGQALGIYRSYDGTNFQACTYPGNFTGGQGWYDLAFSMSPGGVVYAGGVSYPTSQMGVYQSADFGTTWTAIDVGTNGLTPHTDHHCWAFAPNGKVFNGNDGGVYRFSPLSGTAYATKGAVKMAIASTPAAVSTVDADGDGRADVVAVQRGAGTVAVWKNLGGGAFSSPTAYTAGNNPSALVVADLNGDAKPDMAVTSETDSTVTVLLGDGAGGFAPAGAPVPVAAGPVALATGDFNNDGKADLAVSSNSSSAITVLLGDGAGGFTPQPGPTPPAAPQGIAVVKPAGSATDAIVVATPTTDSVSVFAGNGDGTFQAPTTLATGTSPYGVTAADLNGDTLRDLVVANSGSGSVSVLMATSAGAFAAAVNIATGAGCTAARAVDMNGDSIPDIVTANPTAGTVSYLRGATTGFAAAVSAPAFGSPRDVAAADLDGDGRVDAVAGLDLSSTVSIFYGTTIIGRAGRATWETLSSYGLQTIQCMGIAMHPTDPNIALEGSQDNGTARRTASSGSRWDLVYGGDGGLVRFDPLTPNYVYKVAPQGSVGAYNFFSRSADGGISWSGQTSGISQDSTFPGSEPEEDGAATPAAGHAHIPARPPVDPEAATVNAEPNPEGAADTAFPFYPVFAVDPANGQRVVIGSTTVYETKNRGGAWTAIGSGLDGTNVVSALAYAPSADDTIYAGFSDGSLFRTTDDGATWSNISAGKPWGGRAITAITVDPRDAAVAYVTVGSFGGARICRTTTGGSSWSSATGNLPDVPVWTLAMDIRTAVPTLYAGTDTGVWQSADSGLTWTRTGTGLPNVQVFDMDLNPVLNRLSVGTHGRGVWTMSLAAPVIPGDVDNNGTVTPADAVRALEIAAGLRLPSADEASRADVVKSGTVTVDDALAILRL